MPQALMTSQPSLATATSPETTSEADVPTISVCIANWNCVDMLRRCLESLLGQPQGVTFEVVIVDNGSADGAPEMVRREFPKVVLVANPENRGFAKANNQAASVARGRYLFFLNNDTVVPPFALKQFLEFTEANPGVGMIGPRLRGADGLFQISYRRRPTLAALLHRISVLRWTGLFRRAYYDYRRDTFDPEGTRTVEVLMGAAVFLPRTVFEDSGRWDEHYRFGGEDLDLSTQVGRQKPLVYVGDVEIVHHGRVSSRKNISFSAPNVAIGYVHYFRKAGVSPLTLFIYKSLVTLDAPLQMTGKAAQAGVRLICGRTKKAAKSWLAARGLWSFISRELPSFWRA